MHEIITIQCGERANYLATHFWNFQQLPQPEDSSLDYDVLFSENTSPSGIRSYTPRTLIYDHGRSFGSLKKFNALYDVVEQDQSVERIYTEDGVSDEHPFQASLNASPTPNGSLLSDTSVKHWSDYNEQFYRPASYLPVNSRASPASATDFTAGWDQYGVQSANDQDVLDTDLRPFLEECDLLQGINIISSVADSWGGFTARLVQDLSSELPKCAKLMVSCGAPTDRSEAWNCCQNLLEICQNVDAVVPISTPCTSWSSSALPGAWLHNITLPMRHRRSFLSAKDMLGFSAVGHTILSASCGGRSLALKANLAERTFMTSFGSTQGIESKLVNGSIVTEWTHTDIPYYAASYPIDTIPKISTASIIDDPSASETYLQEIARQVTSIRGSKGYQERKDALVDLREMQADYETQDDDSIM